jgi:hypothetical protein
MKRLLALLLMSAVVAAAEEITLTKSAVMKSGHNLVAVRAGSVVELISRTDTLLTVKYKNATGTIPASSIAAPDAPEKETPAATEKEAQTNYGRAVQKAKENAAKHEKNLVKPADEVGQEK